MKRLLVLLVFVAVCLLQGCIAVGSVPESGGSWRDWWIFNMFVLGGVGFWIYCSVWAIILLLIIGNEEGTIATVVMALGLLLMWIIGAFNPFAVVYALIVDHPWMTAGCVIGYVIMGVLWAMFRIKGVSRELSKRYRNEKDNFMVRHGIKGESIPAENQEARKIWAQNCEHAGLLSPRISTYKESIIVWMAWWPLSLCWRIVGKYLFEMFETIYDACEKLFEKILCSSINVHLAEIEEYSQEDSKN